MDHFDYVKWHRERTLHKQAAGIVSEVKDTANKGLSWLFTLAPLAGIGLGYGLSRVTSPRHITKNSDLEILRNNLKTEIAITERQLEEERRLLEAEEGAEDKRPYDRFLN